MIWNGEKIKECIEIPPDVDVEPNGVEMGIKEIERIDLDGHVIIDGDTREIGSIKEGKKDVTSEIKKEFDDGVFYNLESGLYEVRLANKVKIPQGAVGFMFPHSTLNRFGITMSQTAVWDSGYEGYGTLTIDVKPDLFTIGVDEKWFQFVLMDAEDSKGYDGYWQGEK